MVLFSLGGRFDVNSTWNEQKKAQQLQDSLSSVFFMMDGLQAITKQALMWLHEAGLG
jgi:hypothetical protein